MSIEGRVAKLEKAVFNNSVIGRLVVNKEGCLEKLLLSQGYSEEQILDMQKQMIDYITEDGNKPLDIPVTPVKPKPDKSSGSEQPNFMESPLLTFLKTERMENCNHKFHGNSSTEWEGRCPDCKCGHYYNHHGGRCVCYNGKDAVQCGSLFHGDGCGTWYDPKKPLDEYMEKCGNRCPCCLGEGMWCCLDCNKEMYPEVGFKCTKGNNNQCTECEEKYPDRYL